MSTTYNCLIIDDDPLAIAILQNWLPKGKNMLHCLQCSTFEEVKEIISKVYIDIFIIDPDVFYLKKLKYLNGSIDPCKVILMSANHQYKSLVGSPGIYAFWPKPLFPQFILDTLYQVINSSISK